MPTVSARGGADLGQESSRAGRRLGCLQPLRSPLASWADPPWPVPSGVLLSLLPPSSSHRPTALPHPQTFRPQVSGDRNRTFNCPQQQAFVNTSRGMTLSERASAWDTPFPHTRTRLSDLERILTPSIAAESGQRPQATLRAGRKERIFI